MQSLGHGLRHRAAHTRGSQKCGVCSCVQQPLWVMSTYRATVHCTQWRRFSTELSREEEVIHLPLLQGQYDKTAPDICTFFTFFFFLFIKLRDKIATGSFDKTCKLWCAETGKCFHTFRGHMAEIVCIPVCFILYSNAVYFGGMFSA